MWEEHDLVTDGTSRIELTPADLRTVADFAVYAAYAFAEGSERTKALRDRVRSLSETIRPGASTGSPAQEP